MILLECASDARHFFQTVKELRLCLSMDVTYSKNSFFVVEKTNYEKMLHCVLASCL